ncbi:ADP-ribosylglycohydrolase family protein [Roseiconus nitratireducens]|uniref:ADP-ribosylglycohydrolase family protein n=1 Tax=Roseiconus nitratireducens TaxID=2605748 RepID=A0A5M6CTW9_9BACT|nr:ADP-ribosylglycohydrolase family protein [Roseiconus nitratireducens]KAA5538664.1 ADP-ribosylglycohydrolase family protein [Roseiconus nitratireducens]
MDRRQSRREAIVGCILGTAVGDALGLPYEGLSPKRSARLLGPPDRYRFFFRRGMVSDDTEHTCMVAQSLIDAGGDVPKFTRAFARRLRWWILALPAGVGKATARSGIKLWFGASPEKAGVFSAGNGPAMRAAIFGASLDDVPSILNFVRASSRLTHSDPKADYGAFAVALAAKHSRDHAAVDANLWLDEVVDAVGEGGAELIDLLRQAIRSVDAGETTRTFANSLGLERGVTGYTYHTVPVAIHTWLSSPNDFRKAVTSIIESGGDADTTAAIVGGIVGAGVGTEGIPHEWLDGIWEWPRSVPWMQRLGEALADSLEGDRSMKSPTVNPIAVLLRNLLFLFIVLFHGFRRLAPPYV